MTKALGSLLIFLIGYSLQLFVWISQSLFAEMGWMAFAPEALGIRLTFSAISGLGILLSVVSLRQKEGQGAVAGFGLGLNTLWLASLWIL